MESTQEDGGATRSNQEALTDDPTVLQAIRILESEVARTIGEASDGQL